MDSQDWGNPGAHSPRGHGQAGRVYPRHQEAIFGRREPEACLVLSQRAKDTVNPLPGEA